MFTLHMLPLLALTDREGEKPHTRTLKRRKRKRDALLRNTWCGWELSVPAARSRPLFSPSPFDPPRSRSRASDRRPSAPPDRPIAPTDKRVVCSGKRTWVDAFDLFPLWWTVYPFLPRLRQPCGVVVRQLKVVLQTCHVFTFTLPLPAAP